MRIDGVHSQESAGTGPVVLKVVPVTGAAFAGHHRPTDVRLYFPTPTIIIGMKLGMLKVSVSDARDDHGDPLAPPSVSISRLKRVECFNYWGAGIRRFRPRGGHENNTFRGYDYMIPYMVGKLALNLTHFTGGLVK